MALLGWLALAILQVPGGAGAPPASIPRRDVRWDHYVTDWTAAGIFFLRFREHLIYRDHDYEPSVADPDGARRRSIVGGKSPCFDELSVGPNGTQITFPEGGLDDEGYERCVISIVNTDGSGLRRVTTPPEWGEAPVWSPDGTEIAYGGNGVEVLDLGSGEQRIVGRGTGAHWSPDGRRLAFTSYGRTRTWAVFSVARDGSDLRRLTPDDGSVVSGWSPSGRTVLFERAWASSRPSVWVMEADGSHKRRLATGHSARWSPRGDWVAFVRGGSLFDEYPPRSQLFVVPAEGGPARALGAVTRNEHKDKQPSYVSPGYAWAPDGRHLAVSRHASCWRAGIYMVDLRGRTRNLTNDCRIRGTARADALSGTEERDLIWGFGGGDRIRGGSGNDALFGGAGNDFISGGRHRDVIVGGPGKDRIFGGGGPDVLATRDGHQDEVSCGSDIEGRDRAIVDRLDRVSRDCERVSRS